MGRVIIFLRTIGIFAGVLYGSMFFILFIGNFFGAGITDKITFGYMDLSFWIMAIGVSLYLACKEPSPHTK